MWLSISIACVQYLLGLVLLAISQRKQSYAALGESAAMSMFLSGVTCVTSAVLGVGTALNVGVVEVNGRPLLLLRWADWLLITMLIQTNLYIKFQNGGAGDWAKVLVMILVCDASMILCGFVATVSKEEFLFWPMLCTGGVFFLVMMRLQYQSIGARGLGRALFWLTLVAWSLYPAQLVLGVQRSGLLSAGDEWMAFLTDSLSKVVFSVGASWSACRQRWQTQSVDVQ